MPLTMGLSNNVVIVLDALRKQRNLNDYEGDPVRDAVVTECITQAEALLAHTQLPETFIAMLHLTCGIITWRATGLLEQALNRWLVNAEAGDYNCGNS
ncbi:MAG: hypothetical protein Q7T21_13285 [Gallionella sp.]|nr:hypothetical protein [Gallionella sp.]